ncbi:MAG: hypothetical protein KAX49_18350 [Halanaerobiales bacterium]|nr:hypothetical protein [Halanaerobiales bacterium]
MKIIKYFLVVFFFISVICGYIIFSGLHDNKSIVLDSMENFLEVNFFDFKNEEIKILDKGKLKVLFSLSSSCSACISFLDFSKKIDYFFKGDKVVIYNVWKDKIPLTKTKKQDVPDSMNVSLKGRILTEITPSCVILDDENKVIFKTYGSNSFAIVDKLQQIIDKPFEHEILNYFTTNYNLQSKDKLILYFSTDYCDSCKIVSFLCSFR